MTPEEAKIIEIARDVWWLDRSANDPAERELMEALAAAYPTYTTCKSNCDCGVQAECDECYDDLGGLDKTSGSK